MHRKLIGVGFKLEHMTLVVFNGIGNGCLSHQAHYVVKQGCGFPY